MRYDPNNRKVFNEDDFNDVVAEVKTYVSSFTENWMEEKGTAPDLDDFIETNPLWDRWMLYDAINEEIKRVSQIIEREKKNAPLMG
jgi:hypothetical protein